MGTSVPTGTLTLSLMAVYDFHGPFGSGALFLGESALPDSRNLLWWQPNWYHPCQPCLGAGTEISELRRFMSHREHFAQKARQKHCFHSSAPVPLTHAADWAFCSKVDKEKLRRDGKIARGRIKGMLCGGKVPAGYFCLDVRKQGEGTGSHSLRESFPFPLCLV